MTNLHHPRLSGLGRNPAAPDEVLMRLTAHRAGRHGMALRRGQLADAVVEALLTHGDDIVVVGLREDRISPAMRRRIAEHPDPAIRDARANFVRHLVDREVRADLGDLEQVYGRPRTELADDPDPKLRAAVAGAWYDRPLAVQTRLLADPDPRVRAAATVQPSPGVPAEWRDRCLADPAVRGNVAWYVPLTWDQFTELTATEDEDIRLAVAANPHLSAAMVARLLEFDDPMVRAVVAQSRHIDAATRDRLYADEAKAALTWNFTEPGWLREAPLGERLTYLDCPHAIFRRVLAGSRDLPEQAWRRLDDDPDLGVRRAAARRPDAPPDVLERLVRAHGDVFHIRPLHVEHPNFPRHTLRTFVEEPNPNARYVALQDPELPEAALRRLADAEEPFLRRGVARHPNITDELLERLLADPEPEVADEAAANPALGPARMDRILAEAGL
ncbi:hypothetical protein [Streptomyces sp. RG80]|uniref:hypothetical protein n=1 Tax=Streptomyces sp. RG80 TaxID=3157340 RepID=UPI00338EFADF